ncbi:MAG: hypothetical protein ACRENJ_04185 [Candidatus Eiseniibacteriota bacterium]
MRAPLLLALWVLLGFEALGGLVIFVARLVWGEAPGETLHVVAGLLLTAVYAFYQWRHWRRVRPLRPQVHYGLGVIAASFMVLTNLSGLWLAAYWWRHRDAAAVVHYPVPLSAAHNVASMVVLAFVAAHVGAVLFRDRGRTR